MICLAALGAAAQMPRVLSLDEALRIARERQPQLREARAAVEAAQARVDQSRAPFLPQVGGLVTYQHNLRPSASASSVTAPAPGGGTAPAPSGVTTSRSANFYNAAITLNQLIWDFGKTAGQYEASKLLASAQQNAERTVALQIDNNVRAAFFQARATRALVGVAREAVDNFGKHLDQTQGFVEAGTRPEIDLAQARADLANAKAQLIDAQNNYLISKAQLNQAMGVVGASDYDVADESLAPVPDEDAALESVAQQALTNRPELLSIENQVRAQLETVRAFKGGYWPTISGNVGATEGGANPDDLTWNATLGLTLSWQLFQGGETRAQVHEAEAVTGQLSAQLDLQRLQVRLDVEQALLAIRAAKSVLEAQRETVLNARDRLRLAEGRYETGVGNAIELGDAQVALTTAEAQTVQADDRLSTARAQLLRALGQK
ncbi:MAG: TolC family protein [Myxococcales bacterium]